MDRVTGMLDRARNSLNAIPGYGSYQDKEHRRDLDKQVRVAAADQLVQVVDALTAASAAQVAKGDFSQVSAMESLTGRTRTLADRIRTASYGFTGIFADGAIDTAALEQLRLFDVGIGKKAADLAKSAQAGGDLTEKVDAIAKTVGEIDLLFNTRGAVIETARPSTDSAVLDLLDTSVPPPPSPLLEVARGAAFSVLGDDYMANAVVQLEDGDLRISFLRVGKNPDGNAVWFVGASTPDVPSAQLVEEASDTPSEAFDPTTRTATATVDTGKGTKQRVPAEYAVSPQSDDSSVEVLLVLGGVRHEFSGRPIHDADVIVYGMGLQ
ncbi:MAG: hypothetical protein QM753_07115 [Thermomicrobiales bacterium]